MKFDVTIKDVDASELAKLLAHLGGTVAVGAIAAAAPVAAVAAVAANADEDETGDTVAVAGSLDKDGLPWDERIHSTPAKLTNKGVWRARRGVDAGLVAAVSAELRNRLTVTGTITAPGAPAVTAVQPAYQPPQPVAAPVQPVPVYQPPQPAPVPAYDPAQAAALTQPVPVAPVQYQQPAPVAAPVQPQPAAPVYQPAPPVAGLDFNGFMQKVQQLMQMRDAAGNPLVDAPYLASVSSRLGVNAITDIAANQQQIDTAVAIMASESRWV